MNVVLYVRHGEPEPAGRLSVGRNTSVQQISPKSSGNTSVHFKLIII